MKKNLLCALIACVIVMTIDVITAGAFEPPDWMKNGWLYQPGGFFWFWF